MMAPATTRRQAINKWRLRQTEERFVNAFVYLCVCVRLSAFVVCPHLPANYVNLCAHCSCLCLLAIGLYVNLLLAKPFNKLLEILLTSH